MKLRNNYAIYYSLFYAAHYYFLPLPGSQFELYTDTNDAKQLNRKTKSEINSRALTLIKEIGRY